MKVWDALSSAQRHGGRAPRILNLGTGGTQNVSCTVGAQWTGGVVFLKVSLEAVNIKLFATTRNRTPSLLSFILLCSHYVDWAVSNVSSSNSSIPLYGSLQVLTTVVIAGGLVFCLCTAWQLSVPPFVRNS